MNSIDFAQYNNIVIKVGSALVAPDGHSCSTQFCLPLANFIKKCQQSAKKVTLVSSGAVAAGFNTLKPDHEHLSLDEKQALAAIGQSKVINHWQRFFDESVAQLLLTAADIQSSHRSANAKRTLITLQQYGVLPIINENDTVAVDELKFGDNDRLAAQVATLIKADLLLICSDVDGLFNDNPHTNSNAQLIPFINEMTDDIMQLGQASHNPQATGGMLTKLLPAQIAHDSGTDTIICNGKTEAYSRLFQQQNPGTLIRSHKRLQTNPSPGIRITNP